MLAEKETDFFMYPLYSVRLLNAQKIRSASFFLFAEKEVDFLCPPLTHTAFLEAARGNCSYKERFPRI